MVNRRSPAVVAVAQLHIEEHASDTNEARCLEAVRLAAAVGADLVVLPECALTGYRYESMHDTLSVALPRGDPRLARIRALASATRMTVVAGFLERAGDAVHNTAGVFGPDGRAHYTRKTHLPVLGADRFVLAGDSLAPVIAAPFGRVGVAICYDLRFPEVCRTLALRGADVVAAPVNWSSDVARFAAHVVPTRAMENRIHMAVADRAGAPDLVEYLGASQVIDPTGARLTDALDPHCEVAVGVAEVDVALARCKATVFEAGVFEIDVFAHRRPELYGEIASEEEPDDA
jgi:predicted amidohydrolase